MSEELLGDAVASDSDMEIPRLKMRRMVQSDVPAVVAIEASTFSTPWNEETFRSLLERSGVEVWVAEWEEEEEEETVAAYAILWCVLEEGELANLAVRRDLRGKGIGSRLLSRVVEAAAAAGVRDLYLEVRESNRGARRMYAQNGFQEIGVRKGYYDRPHEDARVLRKLLGVTPDGSPSQPKIGKRL